MGKAIEADIAVREAFEIAGAPREIAIFEPKRKGNRQIADEDATGKPGQRFGGARDFGFDIADEGGKLHPMRREDIRPQPQHDALIVDLLKREGKACGPRKPRGSSASISVAPARASGSLS